MTKSLLTIALLGFVQLARADAAPSEAPGAIAPGEPDPAPSPGLTFDRVEMPAKPELSAPRIGGELLLGGLFAVSGAVGGGLLGASIETANGCENEFCGLGGFVIGGTLGMTLAAPMGVYLVGNVGDETGSLGAAYGGALLGTLGGIVGAMAMAGAGAEGGALVVFAAGPVVGSVIGFNLSREYKPGYERRRWVPIASAGNGGSTFGIAGAF